MINAEARHLQADDTVAVDPNGLDAPGQRTSAYDLALFARQALKLPAFLRYDQTISARFRSPGASPMTLYNQNSLLTTYPGRSAARSAGPARRAPPTSGWPPGTASRSS